MSQLSGLISWGDLLVKLFTKNAFRFYNYFKRLFVKEWFGKNSCSKFLEI